jgi:hypothetical protein
MDFQMSNFETRGPRYHHFVLLLWEERGADGRHSTWRFSLQDSQADTRVGFTDIKDLQAFLERWMKDADETQLD